MQRITMKKEGEQLSKLGANLWTQREAAQYLCVSPRYLRASTCPKLKLPGTGKTQKAVLRYQPYEVCKWADSHGTRRNVA